MPDIPEPTPAWNGVPMIETTDRVLGGADGPVNVQARALVARTGWLRAAVESAAADASAAATTASHATARAGAATDAATTAQTTAAAAQTAAASKVARIDLGVITITATAAIALGAGSRSVEAVCAGAQVGDALLVVPTSAIPDGYAVGAGQCLVVGKVRVSVSHPALVLGANFAIPVRIYALR